MNELFVTHGVENLFVVGLTHSHHKIKENEKLVEVIQGPVSITKPMSAQEHGELLAHIWCVENDANGNVSLTPFEYLDVTNSTFNDPTAIPKYTAAVHSLNDRSLDQFLTEFSLLLRETNTESLLCLVLNHRACLRDETHQYLNERNTQDGESIVTAELTKPDKSEMPMPVMWQMMNGRTFCDNCLEWGEHFANKCDNKAPECTCCGYQHCDAECCEGC